MEDLPKVDKAEIEGFFEKNVTVILTVLSFVATVVIIIFITRTRFEAFTKSRSDLSLQTKRTDAMNQKLTGLRALDENSLIEKGQIAKSAVPAEKDVTGLVIGLQQLASGSNVSLVQFSASPGGLSATSSAQTAAPTEGKTAPAAVSQTSPVVEFTATVRGDYPSLESFLKNSMESLRLISLKSVKISQSSSGASSLDMTTVAKAYWKGVGQLGDYSDPLPTLDKRQNDLLDALSKYKVYSVTPQPLPTGSNTSPF